MFASRVLFILISISHFIVVCCEVKALQFYTSCCQHVSLRGFCKCICIYVISEECVVLYNIQLHVTHSSKLFVDLFFIQIWVLAVFGGCVAGLIRLWSFLNRREWNLMWGGYVFWYQVSQSVTNWHFKYIFTVFVELVITDMPKSECIKFDMCQNLNVVPWKQDCSRRS